MKVMCIAKKSWRRNPPNKITVIKKYLFGVFTQIEMRDDNSCDGPASGDICTVVSDYYQNGEKFLNLAEWTIGGYDATCFIPIQEEEVSIEEKGIHKTNP